MKQTSKELIALSDCTSTWSQVRMAEWSKALRSGRSLVLQAWVRIPLLTTSCFERSRSLETVLKKGT